MLCLYYSNIYNRYLYFIKYIPAYRGTYRVTIKAVRIVVVIEQIYFQLAPGAVYLSTQKGQILAAGGGVGGGGVGSSSGGGL